jgi:hypothetical protein
MQPNELLISAAIDMQSEPAGKKKTDIGRNRLLFDSGWDHESTKRKSFRRCKAKKKAVVEVAANRTETANKKKKVNRNEQVNKSIAGKKEQPIQTGAVCLEKKEKVE